jgi:hypothetical protein
MKRKKINKKTPMKKRIKRRVMKAVRPRRRRRTMREEGLSAMFTPETAQAAGRVVGAGAIGGLLGGALNRVLTKSNNLTRLGIQIGASYVTYAVLKYPNMSAGMAGAFAALESKPVYDRFLAEEDEDMMFAQEDSINELPMILNENGEQITLSQDEDGEVIYLNEETGDTMLAEEVFLNEEEVFLNEEEVFLNEGIYPDYTVEY